MGKTFPLFVCMLATAMLVAGTVQTVSLKFQDRTVVDPDGGTFSHPAVQSAQMFVGEMLCLVPYLFARLGAKKTGGEKVSDSDPEAVLEAYFRERSARAKVISIVGFAVPAFCDALATTLLNLGLLLTFASIYQMLRGTLVLFTGLLAVTVLRKRLYAHHWTGMGLIAVGAAIVGAVSVMTEAPADKGNGGAFLARLGVMSGLDEEGFRRLTGDMLIVVAQLLMATQFIAEEKLLTRFKTPPLLAVGLEGFWGLIICGVAMPILSMVKKANGKPLDHLPSAIRQICASKELLFATMGAILAIAFFNAFGLAITKYLAAGTRATVDALRTISVWCVGVYLGWEQFHWLEVVGFVILFSGTCTYNNLLPLSSLGHRLLRREHASSDAYRRVGSADEEVAQRGHPTQILSQPKGHYALARSIRVGTNALSPGPSRYASQADLSEAHSEVLVDGDDEGEHDPPPHPDDLPHE